MKARLALGTLIVLVALLVGVWLFAPTAPSPVPVILPTEVKLPSPPPAPEPVPPVAVAAPLPAPPPDPSPVASPAPSAEEEPSPQEQARAAAKALVHDQIAALQAGNVGLYMHLSFSQEMIRNTDERARKQQPMLASYAAAEGQPPPPVLTFDEMYPDQPGQPIAPLLQTMLDGLLLIQDAEPEINPKGTEADFALPSSYVSPVTGQSGGTLHFYKDPDTGRWY